MSLLGTLPSWCRFALRALVKVASASCPSRQQTGPAVSSGCWQPPGCRLPQQATRCHNSHVGLHQEGKASRFELDPEHMGWQEPVLPPPASPGPRARPGHPHSLSPFLQAPTQCRPGSLSSTSGPSALTWLHFCCWSPLTGANWPRVLRCSAAPGQGCPQTGARSALNWEGCLAHSCSSVFAE